MAAAPRPPATAPVDGAGAGLLRPPLPAAGAAVLAAVLSLAGIATKSFWLDEAFTAAVTGLDLDGLWRTLTRREANAGLYFVLVSAWARVAGDGEVALRLPSAVLAVATVPFVHALTARLAGRRAAAVAALLFAVNAFVVQYAQEARGYALALFLATVSTYSFVRLVQSPAAGPWAGWVASTILLPYSHFFGLFVPAAQAASLLALPRRSLPVRRLVTGGALIALALAPIVLFVVARQEGQINWVGPLDARRAVGAFVLLSGDGGLPLLAAYFGCCLLALAPLARRRSGGATTASPWPLALLVAWLFVPIIAAAVFSLLVRPIFVVRYLIVSLPPLVILAAMGLARLRRPAVVAALVVVVALAGRGLARWYGTVEKEDWREAASWVRPQARAGDAVAFFAPFLLWGFDYYHDDQSDPTPVYPATAWGQLDPSRSVRSDFDRDDAERVAGYDRVWVVVGRADTNRRTAAHSALLARHLSRSHAVARHRTFAEGVEVALWERSPPVRP